MEHNIPQALAAIVALGIAAQWLAWRLKIPSILLLLLTGILVGPVAELLSPDDLFGKLLLPLVSLSVAVVLFEGGMTLRFRELHDEAGRVLFRLVTLGAFVTTTVAAGASRLLLGFDWPLAILLGAILTVTGPTVIGPLLRQLRIAGRAGSILKWEGIVIDPVGAILAVLVFTAIRAAGPEEATTSVARNLVGTALVGLGLGAAGAGGLLLALRKHWVPDPLQNPVTLAMVLSVSAAANLLQPESGLVAVTVMGIAVANQRMVIITHLTEFKENLTVLLISILFILLSARLRPNDLLALGWQELAFVAVLVIVARPAAVLLSTAGSPLPWQERLFLSAMAPRGIVAAAVASVFALEMADAGMEQASRLPPVVFLVIVGTVVLYGLAAGPLARRLGLARANPQGVLFVGAHAWIRAIASALKAEGVPVLLVDSNYRNAAAARMAGLRVHHGSILAEHTAEELDLGDMGRLVALTSNDEVNALACLRFLNRFGRREIYQLPFGAPAEGRHEALPPEQRGRLLFGRTTTFANMNERFGMGPSAKITRLSAAFDYEAFQAAHAEQVLPVFLIRASGQVTPFTAEDTPRPQPGDTIISLTRAKAEASTARDAGDLAMADPTSASTPE